jgi:hypothetical protein
LIGILNEGDKVNHYFKNSERYIRSQGGPVIAAALKGMVVVAAHKRMFYPEEVVEGFMEVNLNKKCLKALDIWNYNIVESSMNFKKYGEENMLQFVSQNEG